ncbi:MAG: PqiC family protein [Puniceicoccales bacterium]
MKTPLQILSFAGLLMGFALLSGCSVGKQSTPSRFYVLSALPQTTQPLPQAQDNPPNVGVAQIRIPSFIDRPQITYRLGVNEIRFSEFNRWGEPISDGITRVVRQNLTELLGAGRVAAFPWMQPYPRNLTLEAVVTDFAAGTDGVAELSVIYRIADDRNKETLLVREAVFVDSAGGNLDDSKAVAALSDTLAQFARAAAEDLLKINREQLAKKAAAEADKAESTAASQEG